jgi:hypothetical protein
MEIEDVLIDLDLGVVMEVASCQVNGKTFDYVLLSRRCVYRAGTRFNVRGVDPEGQVANFVETEQIVQYDGHRCSFVQVSRTANIHCLSRILSDTSSVCKTSHAP